MLPYHDSRITKIVLIVFFVLLVGYAYFEARGFLLGPSIRVGSDTTVVHDPLIRIKGTADRIASLSMNGKDIFVTEQGDFDQPYLLSEGVNRIILDAKDTYGRMTRQVVQVVYQPPTASASDATATTTTSASTTPVAH